MQVCRRWGQGEDLIVFLARGMVPNMGKRDVQEQSDVKNCTPHPPAGSCQERGCFLRLVVSTHACGERAPLTSGETGNGETEGPQMTKRA